MLKSNRAYDLVRDGFRTRVAWSSLSEETSPSLHFEQDPGSQLMDIEWADWTLDDSLSLKFVERVSSSRLFCWLTALFNETAPQVKDESTLFLGPAGAWLRCPVQVGETVVDILAIYFRQVMQQLIEEAD